MKDIHYKITFYSEWHCGSGLTAGSDVDALVVKDADGFPYVPGKTIKGLLKEAAVEMLQLKNENPEKSPFVTEFFGYFDEKPVDESEIHIKGKAFFSNAELSSELRKKLKENEEKGHQLINFLFRDIASTAIDYPSGVAEKSSLRRMETTIPCELFGSIYKVSEAWIGDLEKCMKYVKRMGQNRNRGLGRCKIEIIKDKEDKA